MPWLFMGQLTNKFEGNRLWAEERSKLAWLIQLRWLAVLLQSFAGLFGFKTLLLRTDLAFPFAGTALTLLVFNLYSRELLKTNRPIVGAQIFYQLVVDALAVTLLLGFSGGIRNPFCPLLLVHAAMGAILLRTPFRFWFLTLLIGSLAWLYAVRDWQIIGADAYATDLLPLAAILGSLLIVSQLITWLSDGLSAFRKSLKLSEERQYRSDHLRAMGALTSEFAHQFATPLNTVKIRIARLIRKTPEAYQQELKALQSGVERCEQILRQLTTTPLDTSVLIPQRIEMGAFAQRITQSWPLPNAVMQPRFRVEKNQAYFCTINPVLLSHSLINLLDNAARESQKSSEPIEVLVSGNTERVSVSVLDRGPGWPELVRKKLGEPFNTFRPHGGGTGMGLYNCYAVCESLGGKFEIADRPGGGAIATLTFPNAAEVLHDTK